MPWLSHSQIYEYGLAAVQLSHTHTMHAPCIHMMVPKASRVNAPKRTPLLFTTCTSGCVLCTAYVMRCQICAVLRLSTNTFPNVCSLRNSTIQMQCLVLQRSPMKLESLLNQNPLFSLKNCFSGHYVLILAFAFTHIAKKVNKLLCRLFIHYSPTCNI